MIEKTIEIFVFLFGSIIGSFLNVCIHRMPQEGYSLMKPRSYCPSCKNTIRWYDNIPILSFVLLRGRCRYCNSTISLRYPMVEILTGTVFLIFYNLYNLNQISIIDAAAYVIFICGLIVATVIDIRLRIIPDEISLGGIVVGLLFALVKSFPYLKYLGAMSGLRDYLAIPFIDSFCGALVGGSLVYGSGLLGNLLFFKLMKKESIEGETESIGGGDVKLLAMIGSFIGLKFTVLTFFMAPFFGLAVGLYVLLRKKSHLIAYGPYLSLAALLALFYGNRILSFLPY